MLVSAIPVSRVPALATKIFQQLTGLYWHDVNFSRLNCFDSRDKSGTGMKDCLQDEAPKMLSLYPKYTNRQKIYLCIAEYQSGGKLEGVQ